MIVKHKMTGSATALSTFCIVCCVVSGCQAGGGVIETFDRSSGLTIVTDRMPAVFARTQGRYSRSARDYLYLGPVEVNERGIREYHLWVGVASTLDKDFLAAELTEPRTLVLDIGGAPVEFELRRWNDRLPRLAGQHIYEPPVAPSFTFSARMTLDQLELISSSPLVGAWIVSDQTSTVRYSLWAESPSWPAFSTYAGIR